MTRAYYDTKPTKLEAVGNGSFLYRWDIQEEEVQSDVIAEGNEEPLASVKKVQYSCNEVTVWGPVTANKITEAVISSLVDKNREQKLVNEYNAANLGMYGTKTSDEAKSRIDAYKSYLNERSSLKTQVDTDCEELGIHQD